jgi:hypothetical protein
MKATSTCWTLYVLCRRLDAIKIASVVSSTRRSTLLKPWSAKSMRARAACSSGAASSEPVNFQGPLRPAKR